MVLLIEVEICSVSEVDITVQRSVVSVNIFLFFVKTIMEQYSATNESSWRAEIVVW